MRNSCLSLSTHERYIIHDHHNICSSGHFRWDVNEIDKLPGYMKLCFLVVFNMANDAGYRVMKEKGLDIIPYLKRAVTYTALICFLSSLTHQPPDTFLLRTILFGSVGWSMQIVLARSEMVPPWTYTEAWWVSGQRMDIGIKPFASDSCLLRERWFNRRGITKHLQIPRFCAMVVHGF